jgi:glycosyltransferase involved in cell wall biosynthesis
MKIIQLHDKDLSNGVDGNGTALYLVELIRGLESRGCNVLPVRLIAAHAHRQRGITGQYQVPASCYHSPGKVVSKFHEIIRDEKPDLIHLHSSFFAMHPSVLREISGRVPLICTFHDVTPICFRQSKCHPDETLCSQPVGFKCVSSGCYRPGTNSGLFRDMYRIWRHASILDAYRELRNILVSSSYMKTVLKDNGFDPAKIVVVPLFSRYPATPEISEPGPGIPIVLYCGRLDPEKGILKLIESMGRIKSREWQLDVAGDGPLLATAMGLADKTGIGDRVRFQGSIPHDRMRSLYLRCRMVVVPSMIAESFCLVGVEAMSQARPVVAFNSGGIAEWLQDGSNGYLVEHGNINMLAQKIDTLLSDPPALRRMGGNALKDYKARFDAELHHDRIMGCYQTLLGDGLERTGT